jgi:regulator of protease activity HflC (stomatin/prohibitin superfamily)
VQALIDFLVRNLLALWPIAVVQFNERAIRIRMGLIVEELEPDWYWRWPFFEKVLKCPATWDWIDLQFGDVPTNDGVQATFSANVEYRILSPALLWSNITDPDTNLSRLALGSLASLVARKDWAALAANQPSLRTWLRKQLTAETKGCGVEVGRVRITNLVQARPIRILADGGVGAVLDDDEAA